MTKVSQKKSARMMRSAVAFDRCAAKAHKAGDNRSWARFMQKSADMKAKAARMKERGQ